ncbi:MAG: exodeoxyribonuclease VII small subunit [Erythrobacter sp.]
MSETENSGADLNFEQALSALEEIVQRLESGDVPLDQSIALYEKGEALRKQCQSRLDAAQQRIEQIVADKDGKASSSQPFDAGQ